MNKAAQAVYAKRCGTCCAGELARALLYTRAPDWAEREAAREEERPETQRLGCAPACSPSAPACSPSAPACQCTFSAGSHQALPLAACTPVMTMCVEYIL